MEHIKFTVGDKVELIKTHENMRDATYRWGHDQVVKVLNYPYLIVQSCHDSKNIEGINCQMLYLKDDEDNLILKGGYSTRFQFYKPLTEKDIWR